MKLTQIELSIDTSYQSFEISKDLLCSVKFDIGIGNNIAALYNEIQWIGVAEDFKQLIFF